jgi:signal transduction histidine kinase
VRALPLSFRARLTLRWTFTFALLLACAEFAVYAGVRGYVYAALDRHARALAATEAVSTTDGPDGAVHVHEYQPRNPRIGAIAEKLVQVFDEKGRLLKQSALLGDSPALIGQDQMASALRGEGPIVSVTAGGRPARLVLLRASRGGQGYVVAAGLFADEIEAGLARLMRLLALVWIGAIVATGALGDALASSALERVAQITDRAASIAHGDFSARLDAPPVQDEIGRMTRSLNAVLERLHAAIQANRRFAADASHELRGPLTAMAGEIDVALKQQRTTAEYRETLTVVREGLDTLKGVTEDLMLLVRTQESRADLLLREVPLAPLVRASAGRLAAIASARDVTVSVEIAPSLAAFGEERLLGRVFDNVLANAVRYNRPGGRVSVTAAFADVDGDAWTPGMLTVRVADTGVGIPEAERHRVFERFYRLDSSRARHTGGAGLGLAICREVVAVLGGDIRIADSSDAGTIVEVRVPGHDLRTEETTAEAGTAPTSA